MRPNSVGLCLAQPEVPSGPRRLPTTRLPRAVLLSFLDIQEIEACAPTLGVVSNPIVLVPTGNRLQKLELGVWDSSFGLGFCGSSPESFGLGPLDVSSWFFDSGLP